jgi:hypothetical protein
MYEKKKKSKRNFTQNATARSPGRDLVTDVTVVRQQRLDGKTILAKIELGSWAARM